VRTELNRDSGAEPVSFHTDLSCQVDDYYFYLTGSFQRLGSQCVRTNLPVPYFSHFFRNLDWAGGSSGRKRPATPKEWPVIFVLAGLEKWVKQGKKTYRKLGLFGVIAHGGGLFHRALELGGRHMGGAFECVIEGGFRLKTHL